MTKNFILPVLLLLCQFALAQKDTVYLMEELVVSDTQLRDFSYSQSMQSINDSVIRKNGPSLSSLLQYNTVIYFKENGRGMVSSPSFRGTTAQQTAVIWNGININSQLNGLTDFNTVTTRDFNSIAVRAGGGSVIYGSSAIGGSIHLNNDIIFNRKLINEVQLEYGSFNTLGANYKMAVSNDRFSANVSISRNSSDNDYEFPGYTIKNENGEYYNTSFTTGFAYKVNDRHILKLYNYLYEDDRHFSRTIVAPSKSKYENFNVRNLLEWTAQYSKMTQKVKAAYLTEEYKYFENYQRETFEFGKVNTFIGKYDLSYYATDDITLNAIVDYTQNNGEGTDISLRNRNIGSGSLLIKHALSKKLRYELGLRKEVTDVYDSPLLFSLGTAYDMAKFYSVRINASRNFRIPTFNDLYWQGSGNPDLKPETSYQAELGNEIKYGEATLTITGYYIKLTDMLRWVPGVSIWGPENVGKVNTYGVEGIFSWEKNFGSSRINLNATYAYTESHEEGESEQLIYVPYHKGTASLSYSYKNLSAYYQHLFNGEVFTTSDNSNNLDAYNVSGIGAEYNFKLLKGFCLGAQVQNLWNEEYQNVAMRPLPGRNYNMYINFKF